MKTKRIISLLLAVALICTCFYGCSDKSDGENETPLTDETTTMEETTQAETTEPLEIEQNLPSDPETDSEGNYINRLTGLYDVTDEGAGKRPMAVMINNIKAALPSYGISDADIIYEIVVEGGITRMMAIYADYTQVPEVCSVRSCRYYYPIFAKSYDAVYFCFGSNKLLGNPQLEKTDHFDGNKGYSRLFARDAERLKTYSSEHTAYLKGPDLPSALEHYGMRTDYAEGRDVNAFNFAGAGTEASGSKSCTKAVLTFSKSYYSTFNYNEETGTYYKLHSGNNHTDQRSGEQLNFTNLFVLQTDVHVYNDSGIMEVDWKGGNGYYITKGTVQEITWEKPTEDSEIKFYAADGSELTVNRGKSYIGVISEGKTTLN